MTVDPALTERTIAGFREHFGRSPTVVAFAPGRVNLIGEHTDYNDGFALPCALPFGTVVALAPRNDNRIEVRALDLDNETAGFSLNDRIARMEDGRWENHVGGVISGMAHFDLPVRGADLAMAGNIPQGAGLSSSASLGVATAFGLAVLGGRAAPHPLALARTAQWSEHHYVGCACGMMDQLASAFGQEQSALLIDCRTMEARPVTLPPGTAIMVVHSGVVRGLVDSAYNDRRKQCARAAEHYGVAALRDMDCMHLEAEREGLDEVVFRRARHVITENGRTLQAVEAIADGDLVKLGNALRGSHASLRDDFEVSVAEVDALVECLNTAIGAEGGARMTGGGFGGCVVAVMHESKLEAAKRALVQHWNDRAMMPQMSFIAAASQGARLLVGG
jgi:galactokinase